MALVFGSDVRDIFDRYSRNKKANLNTYPRGLQGTGFRLVQIAFCSLILYRLLVFVPTPRPCSYHSSSSSITMLQVHSADLQQQCVDLFRQISSSTQSAVEIAQVAKAWSTLEQAITASAREGSLDAQTASAISTLVFNVKIVATSRATLEEESKLELTNLADELHSINLVVSDGKPPASR